MDRPSAGCSFPHPDEALAFFKEIEQNKPDLVSFDSADKWQLVRDWLSTRGSSRNDDYKILGQG
jgi:hypothetical protein